MTLRLATTLDKNKISKRNTMHLLMAFAEALEVDTKNLIANVTSIHEARKLIRKERYEKIKSFVPALFSTTGNTIIYIHWDSKLLPGYLRTEIIDRLAIIITNSETEQVLEVPIIDSSTGFNQAHAVYDTLVDWSLVDGIEALCCDLTSSNTGWKNGTCPNLERLLNKELFYFICCHHIYELILRCFFEKKFGKTSGPETQQFKSFEKHWKTLDLTKFDTGISDDFVAKSLEDVKDRILEFCENISTKQQVRSDL